MTSTRFNEIAGLALQCKRRLTKYGYLKRNLMPIVSFAEHKELMVINPKIARFTRCFDYADSEYVEDVNRASSSRRPIVREIWVGARSLSCLGEEDGLPQGHQLSQMEHEDAAEMTDLMTMLYDNPIAFDEWVEQEVTRRILEFRGKRFVNNVIIRRHMRKLVLADSPTHSKTGKVAKCMIEDDETGELRPVRCGDTLTRAHGSNENLDALYMDEPQDPRSDDDDLIRELLGDRVNANSEFEQDMLNDARMVIPSDDDDLAENDLYLRKVANHLASKMVERNPKLEPVFLQLREHAFQRVRKAHLALRTDEEGKIKQGRFLRPKDIWDEREDNFRKLKRYRAHRRTAAPAPVDWSLIRNTQQNLSRSELMASIAAGS